MHAIDIDVGPSLGTHVQDAIGNSQSWSRGRRWLLRSWSLSTVLAPASNPLDGTLANHRGFRLSDHWVFGFGEGLGGR
jgi:hypothetical protein